MTLYNNINLHTEQYTGISRTEIPAESNWTKLIRLVRLIANILRLLILSGWANDHEPPTWSCKSDTASLRWVNGSLAPQSSLLLFDTNGRGRITST